MSNSEGAHSWKEPAVLVVCAILLGIVGCAVAWGLGDADTRWWAGRFAVFLGTGLIALGVVHTVVPHLTGIAQIIAAVAAVAALLGGGKTLVALNGIAEALKTMAVKVEDASTRLVNEMPAATQSGLSSLKESIDQVQRELAMLRNEMPYAFRVKIDRAGRMENEKPPGDTDVKLVADDESKEQWVYLGHQASDCPERQGSRFVECEGGTSPEVGARCRLLADVWAREAPPRAGNGITVVSSGTVIDIGDIYKSNNAIWARLNATGEQVAQR